MIRDRSRHEIELWAHVLSMMQISSNLCGKVLSANGDVERNSRRKNKKKEKKKKLSEQRPIARNLPVSCTEHSLFRKGMEVKEGKNTRAPMDYPFPGVA